MKRLLILLLISTYPAIALSGTATGKIKNVLVHSLGGNGSGVFMFEVDGQRSSPPSCSTVAGGKAWAFSLEKESGRAMYALALAAYSQGKTVFVNGSGTYNSWADREEPRYLSGQ